MKISKLPLIFLIACACNSAWAFNPQPFIDSDQLYSNQLQELIQQQQLHADSELAKVMNNQKYKPNQDNVMLSGQVVSLISKVIISREKAVNRAASEVARPVCQKSVIDYKKTTLLALKTMLSEYQATPMTRRMFAFSTLINANAFDGAKFITGPMYVCGPDYINLNSLVKQ